MTTAADFAAGEDTSPSLRSLVALRRARRRVAVMIAAGLIYAVALFVVAVRSADRGFFTFQGGAVLVVDPSGPAAAAGLAVGDVITAVDGRPITSAVERFRALQAVEPGHTLALDVVRGGEHRHLTLALPRRVPLASAAAVALALVLLALALVADRGRHHALPQQFLRSTVIYVVFLAGAFALDVTISSPWLTAPWVFAMFLASPATCHFMLRFPAGPPRIGRAVLWLLYGPPLALATVAAANHVSFALGHPLPARGLLTRGVGWLAIVSAAGYLVAGALARARRMRRLRDRIDPLAIRWLQLGGVVMTVPLVLSIVAGADDVNRFIAGGFRPYVAVTMVGGSACVVMAMTRVRFGELDRLWRRSSGYLLATLCAAGLYLVAIAGLGGAASAHGSGFWVTLAATLAAAIVFGPLRVRVQRMIDQRFTRDRSRARRLLRDAAEGAVATLDIELLGRGLVDKVKEALGADGAALMVGGDAGWRLEAAAGRVGAVTTFDRAAQLALDGARAARAPRELPGGAVAVPVPVDERRPAVIVVVPHDGERYDDEELELLSTAAAGFAIALGNARAHRSLRELTERLRREVEIAERRRREIARLKDRLEDENRALIGELAARTGKAPVIGSGLAATFALAQKVARADATVLVRGETGVGKELIARAIHAASPRRSGPFIVVDCGAIAAGLAESALFGHERGAFTGAVRSAVGAFRAAHGGTLFLDELGELPLELQPKLLRALQEREVHPLGAEGPVAVDVRVVCGTNRDLEAMAADGAFRDDLLYRLRVVELAVPPLRARKADLPALAEHFLARIAARGGPVRRLGADALALCMEHDWPGNVRELEHALEAAAVYAEGEEIGARDLPVAGKVFRKKAEAVLAAAAVTVDGAPRAGLRETLGDLERERLTSTLRACDGNRSRAAKALGMSRGALLRRLKRYGLDVDDSAAAA